MRIWKLSAPFAAALALVVVFPGTASAATGTFSYELRRNSGHVEKLKDPQNGKCYSELSGWKANNQTDVKATLYRYDDCEDPVVQLAPGTKISLRFMSVKFG
ncbi:hypothetical protein OG203_05075 [Nocardia sp. NBC_01499]|uniref:hypothetical protein n=1 Tax=Nocardia sp. NBC_01499 TaxID=2903597 RepID=UPI00386C156C